MVPAKAPDFPKRRNKTVGNDRNCLAPTTEAATASASSSRETSTTGSSSSTSAASGGATSHSTAARCTSATSRSTTGSTLGNTTPLGLCGTCNYVRYKRITDREGMEFVPGGGLGLGRNLKVDPLAKQFKTGKTRGRREYRVLFQWKKLVSADEHLVTRLERGCDNTLLRLDGKVHLVNGA